MAEKYCVFLRGVNVNGVKMKMDALRNAFVSLSFGDARTILATGNVIITAESGANALKPVVEDGLGSCFGYDAFVFVRSAAELQAVASASKTAAIPPDCHLYYLLCDERGIISELNSLFAALPHKAGEAFIPLDTGAFWIVPVGETLESPFGSKVLGDKKYKCLLTSRNMNTIDKILNAMGVS